MISAKIYRTKSIAVGNVFYIHSNITLLSSLGVIEKYQLSNVVFLFARNFQTSFIKISHKIIWLSDTIEGLSNVSTEGNFRLFWLYRRLKMFDCFINNLNFQKLHFYLPHTNNFLMQAFITHQKAHRYSIVEEGLLNYNLPQAYIKQTDARYLGHSKFKKAIRYLKHFNRSVTYKSIGSNLDGIYLFQEKNTSLDSFDINRIYFPLVHVNLEMYNPDRIFVFDNSIDDNVIEESIYYELLGVIFRSLNHEKLFVKFHPAQKNTEIIRNLLSQFSIDYLELPADFPLELYFLKCGDLKVYGLWSSLLYYAAISGNYSYSYMGIASEMSSKARIWSQRFMPYVFYEKVNII